MFTLHFEESSLPPPGAQSGEFCFGGRHGHGVAEYADLREEPEILQRGTWIVCAEFDGPWHAWRVEQTRPCEANHSDVIPVTEWSGPAGSAWETSMTQAEYEAAVREILRRIGAGELQQVNLGRVLSAPLPAPGPARTLGQRLGERHPAPHAGWFDVPAGAGGAGDPGLWLVSASPELGLRVREGVVTITPIKGTAPTAAELLEKDRAENELVTQAVLADLGWLCPDARVTAFQDVHHHPGLVQLVSTVTGTLEVDPAADPAAWAPILEATCPPGSVFGVPRVASARAIADLEAGPRGPYCGQVGWIDADAGQAQLAVVIRSFWWTGDGGGRLHFGAGAGITAGSDPAGEWVETELKARRLLAIAAGTTSTDNGKDPS